jgi:hypothetical protein
MTDNYNIYSKTTNEATLSCGSNSVDFLSVDGFTVFDAESKICNCGCEGCDDCSTKTSPVRCQSEDKSKTFPLGTVIDACRGLDDVLTLQFALSINVKPEYDIGLYINTVGGDGKYESLGSRRGMAGSFGRCQLPAIDQVAWKRNLHCLTHIYCLLIRVCSYAQPSPEQDASSPA